MTGHLLRMAVQCDHPDDRETLHRLFAGVLLERALGPDLVLTTTRGESGTIASGFTRLGYGPSMEVLARGRRLALRGPDWTLLAGGGVAGPISVRLWSPGGTCGHDRLLLKVCWDHLGTLAERRRLGLALHAAAIQLGGRLVLLLGHSGFGKSSLATALVRSGRGTVIADDSTILARDPPAAVFFIRRTSGAQVGLHPLESRRALEHHLVVRHRRALLVAPARRESGTTEQWARASLSGLVAAVPHYRVDVGLGAQAEAATAVRRALIEEVMQAG